MGLTLARALWGYIDARDQKLMSRLHRWYAPHWVRIWMISATRLGDGWLWYSLGVILLLFGGLRGREAALAAGSAVLSGVLLFQVLKRISRRKRPCHLQPHCWAMILPPDQFSFPSGHSITAFAVAIPIGLIFPELQTILLFTAASIAASRIVLGMHFLSDVLAGSAIGTALGYMAFLLMR